MQRDTASDSAHYKPSLRHIAETDYWSDDNICRKEVNQTYNLWNTPLSKMAESKDQTIDDAQLTQNTSDQTSQVDNNGKNKKVQFDESQNQIHSQNGRDNDNFMPGSNISPSLLSDPKPNTSQTKKTGKSARKRSNIPDSAGQNDDISNISPLQKRQKLSNQTSNNDNDLSFEELQRIQTEERNKFQAELYRDGFHSQFDDFDAYGDQYFDINGNPIRMRQHGNNQGNHKNSRSDNNYNQGQSGGNNQGRRDRNNGFNNNNNNNNRSAAGGGGGPGGDSSDDQDDNKDNKKDNINQDDSDSQSEDSDDDNQVTSSMNNSNSNLAQLAANKQIADLSNQNTRLQQNLEKSNERIQQLMSNNSNSNNNNNNANPANDILVYQEMIKQQQFQMQQLMR